MPADSPGGSGMACGLACWLCTGLVCADSVVEDAGTSLLSTAGLWLTGVVLQADKNMTRLAIIKSILCIVIGITDLSENIFDPID